LPHIDEATNNNQVTQRDFYFRLYMDVKQDRCAEIENVICKLVIPFLGIKCYLPRI